MITDMRGLEALLLSLCRSKKAATGNTTCGSLAFLIILGTLFWTGCVSRQPNYQASNSTLAQAQRIYILPVFDARTEKVADPSFNRIVQKHASDVLKRKRYQYEALTDPAYVAHVTSIEPQDTNSEWMPKLGPPEARWVMLFAIEVLNKYQNKITRDSQAQAVLSMVVIDKQTQSVIWRDRHSYWTGTVPSYLVAVWESNPAGRPAAAAAALMAQWHEQSGLYDAMANSVIMMLQPKFPKCQNRL